MPKGPVEVVSTKIRKIDEITDIGGLPKGHILELCGDAFCGKTALAVTVANNISNKYILFVDTEHTADTKFFRLLGIDENKILLCQPNNVNVALGVIKKLVGKKLVDCVIVDTMTAIISQYELEQPLLSNFLQAGHYVAELKFMREFLRCIRAAGCIGILVDQIRAIFHPYLKDTIVGYDTISDTIKFFSSIRILLTRGRFIRDKENKVVKGFVVKLKVIKNKFAAPFRQCRLIYYLDKGFC